MTRKYLYGVALIALGTTFLGWPVSAQTPTVENAQGMARHWTNIASFTQVCIKKGLVEKTYEKSASFGSYLGGFLLGSLYRDQNAVTSTLTSYLNEGGQGRVHEFDQQGTLMAYDIEFTAESCATIANALKSAFDQFSKAVLEKS